jgi:hypothetical protein
MIESWLPFFEWCEATTIGNAVRMSLWAFPVLEAVHLLGLCVLGGAVLLVDLRMLGLGLKQQRIAEVARDSRRYLVVGVLVMIATGVPLFLSEAIKCFYNQSFWVKMATLFVALLFTFFVRERAAHDDTLDTSTRSRLIGAASIAIWFTVAAAGRSIAYS